MYTDFRRVTPGRHYGGVAQLGERLHGMQEVRGSIPLVSTRGKFIRSFCCRRNCGFFFSCAWRCPTRRKLYKSSLPLQRAFLRMVRLARVELAACRLGGGRSIHLSYNRRRNLIYYNKCHGFQQCSPEYSPHIGKTQKEKPREAPRGFSSANHIRLIGTPCNARPAPGKSIPSRFTAHGFLLADDPPFVEIVEPVFAVGVIQMINIIRRLMNR